MAHNSECGLAKPIASYSSAIVTRSRTAVASNHESNDSSGRGAVRSGNARSAVIADGQDRSEGPASRALENPRIRRRYFAMFAKRDKCS
jgi:hypothetical protein